MEKNLINSKKNYKKLYLKYKKKYNLLKGGSGFSEEDTNKAIENSLKDQENILQRYVLNPTSQLSENLSKFGLKWVQIPGDGNCFFAAVKKSGNLPQTIIELREKVYNYLINSNFQEFNFVPSEEEMKEIKDASNSGVWVESEYQITAMANILQRPIIIWNNSLGNNRIIKENLEGIPINIIHMTYPPYNELPPNIRNSINSANYRPIGYHYDATEPISADVPTRQNDDKEESKPSKKTEELKKVLKLSLISADVPTRQNDVKEKSKPSPDVDKTSNLKNILKLPPKTKTFENDSYVKVTQNATVNKTSKGYTANIRIGDVGRIVEPQGEFYSVQIEGTGYKVLIPKEYLETL
jgi:hypothetical protein